MSGLHIHSEEFYMGEALKQARMALADGEVPVGAVVVCNNRIIARAYNQVERLQDVTAHAEVLAITSAANHLGSKYLSECSLYVTLEPCCMCAGAGYWAQLAKVVFGASDPRRGFRAKNETMLHPKTEISFGLLEKDCSEILSEFFKNMRG